MEEQSKISAQQAKLEVKTVFIDPRTNEPCKRCDGTGKMPPWPGSKGLVACGVCRETEDFRLKPPASSPEVLIQSEAHEGMSWARIVVEGRGDIIGVRILLNGEREFLMHNEALCNPYYVAVDGSSLVSSNPIAPRGEEAICKFGDKFCPCPDGDPCHYEGENPFPAPLPPSEAPTEDVLSETQRERSDSAHRYLDSEWIRSMAAKEDGDINIGSPFEAPKGEATEICEAMIENLRHNVGAQRRRIESEDPKGDEFGGLGATDILTYDDVSIYEAQSGEAYADQLIQNGYKGDIRDTLSVSRAITLCYARKLAESQTISVAGAPSQWISVKDRMPPVEKLVLLVDRSHENGVRVGFGWLRNLGDNYRGKAARWVFNNHSRFTITHWQPLPAPPNGGTE